MQETVNGISPQVFTVKEAAKQFQPPVNPVTIYRQIYAGKIKVLDGLGIIRIPRSELDKFFNKVVTYVPQKRAPRVRKVKEVASV